MFSCARAVEATLRSDADANAVALAKAALALLVGGEADEGSRLAEEAAHAGGIGLAQVAGRELSERGGLPIELCVGAVLPFAMAFNRKAATPQLADLAPSLGGPSVGDVVKRADAAIAAIRDLGLRHGFPPNFRKAGIKREAMEATARALPQLTQALVRPVTSYDDAMLELFRFAW